MAAFFVDIDGTVTLYGTNTLIPSAVSILKELILDGHQVIFTTYRDHDFELIALLKKIDPKPSVLFRVQSPRVVVNDDGAYAINHIRNADWTKYRREFADLPIM